MQTKITIASMNAKEKLCISGVGCDITDSNRLYYKMEYAGREAIVARDKFEERGKPLKDQFSRELQYPMLRRSSEEAVLSMVEKYEFKHGISDERDFTVASGFGWQKDKVYITQRSSFMATNDHIVVSRETDSELERKWAVRGTLEEWQKHIAKPCGEHVHLAFDIMCAFVPPLLRPLREGGFCFNTPGAAGSGKTTKSLIAGSVWGSTGDDRGFLEKWRTTDNAIEDIACQHNDILACMDDISCLPGSPQQKATTMVDSIFCYTGGRGKNRKNGGTPVEWNGVMLSSSNKSGFDLLNEAGRIWSDEHMDRFLEIPIGNKGDNGRESVLDFLPDGYSSHKHYIDGYLHKKVRRYYGTAIDVFMERFCEECKDKQKRSQRLKWLRKRVSYFIKWCEKNRQGGRGRPERRFALVYAAGMLAKKYGVLPWSRKRIFKVVVACYTLHFNFVRQHRPVRPEVAVAEYIRQNKKRFIKLPDDMQDMSDEELNDCPGFRFEKQGQKCFWIPEKVFIRGFMGKYEANLLWDSLGKSLVTERNGKTKDGTPKIRRLLNRKVRTNQKTDPGYAIKASILSDVPLQS
ncbi:MAG: DUF927 domain-containing protein [Alphaproteobacteria bacterium]